MTDAIVKAPIERVKNYIMSAEVKERFAEMMGHGGIYYLNQVMIMVANSPRLAECEPKSILISAMRAAALRLPVDPALGQAWIIPYKKTATFQIGYRGIYELAMRTGLYRFVNVITIYEGEEVTQDRMTGQHEISGARTDKTPIGYMLYFQLTTGFEKTFYMTVQEIEAHAARYSQSYNDPRSPWATDREKMMMKTVLSNGLRKWGRFQASDLDTLNAIEDAQGWVENDLPEENQVTVPPPAPKRAEAEIMADLGFSDPREDVELDEIAPDEPDPLDIYRNMLTPKGKRLGDLIPADVERLLKMLQVRDAEGKMTDSERRLMEGAAALSAAYRQ